MTNSKAKHTPGPWEAHDNDGTVTLPCVLSEKTNCGGNFYVARCPNGNFADARLIAAAPELLEALRFCVKMLDDDGGKAQGVFYSNALAPHTDDMTALEYLQATIAKAEGKGE